MENLINGNPNPVENQEYFGKASDKNSDKSIKSNSNQQTPPFKSFKDQTPDDLNPYPKNNSLKHPQVKAWIIRLGLQSMHFCK